MPMIQLTTNVTVSDSAKARLAAGLGEAISLLPGKNEGQLMLSISGENYMAFQGRDDRSVAYVSTGIAGKTDAESCKKFGEAVIRLLGEVLLIPFHHRRCSFLLPFPFARYRDMPHFYSPRFPHKYLFRKCC